tara:strand:- start:24126 stop:24269 length:144 start_codon:yes stop_codon:yes gene_type:complete
MGGKVEKMNSGKGIKRFRLHEGDELKTKNKKSKPQRGREHREVELYA